MKKSFSIGSLFILVVFLALIMAFGISPLSENGGFFAYGDEYQPDGSMADIHAEFYNNGYWDGASPKLGCYPLSSQLELQLLSDLINNAANINGCVFYMTNDIDLTGFENVIGVDIQFDATFDGCGYTLSNLDYSGTGDQYYAGLFCQVGEGGIIKRVNLTGAEIYYSSSSNELYVGALVGKNYGLIDKCSVTDSYIMSQSDRDSYAGGLVGKNEGIVLNSYVAHTTVEADYVYGFGEQNPDYNPYYKSSMQNCFCFEVLYISAKGNPNPFSNESLANNNCYWYSSTYEDRYYHLDMSDLEDFTSGKVCIALNGSSHGRGSEIFGQDLSSDDYPVFLSSSNKDSHYIYTINFFYEGIFYESIAANYGKKVSRFSTPYWVESDDTVTYMCKGNPFTTDTEIFENCKVDVSGGAIIQSIDALLLSDDATGKGTQGSPLVISSKEDLLVLANASKWELPVVTSTGDSCSV